jgi:hypothetical protein
MAVITQLYFKIVEEINYMFRHCSGWAIIRLTLEYRRKLIHTHQDVDVHLSAISALSQRQLLHKPDCLLHSHSLPVKPTQPRTDQPTFSNSTSKATSEDDSSPHVDEPTEDMTNKVVTCTDSTSRIYTYAPPQPLQNEISFPHS